MQKSRFLAAVAASVLLSSCSGSLGGAGGGSVPLTGPVAPNVNQPYAAPTPLDRERTLDDTVAMLPSTTSLALPPVLGFSIAIDLSPPTPQPSGGAESAEPSPAGSAAPAHPLHSGAGARGASILVPSGRLPSLGFRSRPPAPVAIDDSGILIAAGPTPAPSAASTDAGDVSDATPAGSPGATTPSPAASGGAASPSSGTAAPAAASPVAHAKPTHRPSPKPSPSGPIAEVKVTIYPDYAPKPPSPKIQSPVTRVALVRGYVKLPNDQTLGSLAAVKFTVPAGEVTPGRGFTIALYDERKKKKPRLIVADTAAVASKDVIAGASDDIIELKAGNPYSFVLFADAQPPSPPPAGNYPAPGLPPGVTPNGPQSAPSPGAYPNGAASGLPQAPAGYNQPYGTPTLTATIPPSYPTFPPQ